MGGTAQDVLPEGSHGGAARSQPLPNQIALVTGGSRGIGRALAGEFAAHGHAIGLVARHGETLEAAAEELRSEYGVPVHIYAHDLTALNAAERLRAAVEADGLKVKYLVNNAGAWSAGAVVDTDIADLEHVVTTNALVPLRLTKAFMPHLAATKGGVLNVGSLAGSMPTPTFAIYGASKAFLGSLSLAMRHELKAHDIPVCVVMPGIVRTGFTYSGERSIWYKLGASTPQAVAFAAYRGFLSGQATVVPGLLSRVIYFGIGVLPRAVTQGILDMATAWRRS